MQAHTMSSQAEADAERRHFKRDVAYRSVRASTHKAFSSFRKDWGGGLQKVEEFSGPLKRRPLEQLENEDSPRAAVRPRRLPGAPLKRSAAPSPLRSPQQLPSAAYLGPAAQLRTPARPSNDSDLSDFGDSPALFQYKQEPRARAFPAALRRSVRSLVSGKTGKTGKAKPSPPARPIRKRASKHAARRRIQQLASPRTAAAALTDQLNDLVANIAALRPAPNTPRLA